MFENFFLYYKNAHVVELPDLMEQEAPIVDSASRLRLALPPDVMSMLMCSACMDPGGPNPAAYYRMLRREIDRLWTQAAPNGHKFLLPLYDGQNRLPEPPEFLYWLLVEYLKFLEGNPPS